MSEESSLEDCEIPSISESMEANCGDYSLKKESGDLFRSESDIETSVSESYSEDIEANSSTSSFVKESTEDVFEFEQDGTENESKSFNVKQISATSVEPQQLGTEDLATDSSTSSLEKGSVEDEFEDQQDGTEKESYGKAEHCHTVITKSSKFATEALKIDSTSNLDNASIEESFKHDLVEDGTRSETKSVSNAEKSTTPDKSNAEKSTTPDKSNAEKSTTPDKSPQSPTGAMKALRISDENSSGNKGTPRQSRFRAKTFNIFDSPYNTRLKARMIQEREMRSRSAGGSTDE